MVCITSDVINSDCWQHTSLLMVKRHCHQCDIVGPDDFVSWTWLLPMTRYFYNYLAKALLEQLEQSSFYLMW